MNQILFLVGLVGLCAALCAFPAKVRKPVAWIALAIGVAVFAIRLQHEGPYALPQRRNLASGLLALALGVGLLGPWLDSQRLVTRIALALTPVVLFLALYAVLAEVEEVVVLRAPDASGEIQDLRLWIVDRESAAWVTMPRWKADAHGLTDARVELLRAGVETCVLATRFEERDEVDATHRLRHEKYAVQRLATVIGMFGRTADPDTVTLRLTPCPPAAATGSP